MSDGSPNGAVPPELGAQLYREIVAELQQNGRTTRRPALENAIARTADSAGAAELANLLTHCCFVERDYAAALDACRQWLELAPDNPLAKDTLLSVLSRLNRFEEVAEEANSRLA